LKLHNDQTPEAARKTEKEGGIKRRERTARQTLNRSFARR
jgi:hypothetical protein